MIKFNLTEGSTHIEIKIETGVNHYISYKWDAGDALFAKLLYHQLVRKQQEDKDKVDAAYNYMRDSRDLYNSISDELKRKLSAQKGHITRLKKKLKSIN
jgi:hypothetical protein